jgi:hypothetical protein
MSGEVACHPRVVDLQRQDYPRIVVWIGHHNFFYLLEINRF